MEQIKDDVRAARPGAFIEATVHDLRYAVRLLRRSPGFAMLAIVAIAIGIGANSAIVSVINGVVRKPLAYPASGRLMFLTSQFPRLNFAKFWISPPEYYDFKEHTRRFSDVAAYTTSAVNVSEGDVPERVAAGVVTANMFKVLGVAPYRGTTFTDAQDLPGAEPVVVLSYELWQRMFGRDESIVGRAIQVQGRSRTVVGIMPAGFDLHDTKALIWIPLGLDPTSRQNRGSHFLYLVARLAPDATREQANAELNGMLTQWSTWAGAANVHAPNDSTHRVQMTSLQEEVVGNVGRALWILQGAAALVLLIACANVANLLLARAESRHKEFAVRAALGAGRIRILRQFMAEGVVLAVAGALAGVVLASWGLKALLAANPRSIPRASEIALDPLVLIITTGVALLTGLVFGLAPLLHLSEKNVSAAIKEGGTRTTVNAGRARARRGLVVAEIALAVMLVIGAGLLITSFRNLTRVDAGFDSHDRVTFGLVLPVATYADSQRRVTFFTELQRQLAQIPGVQSAGVMQGLPPLRQVNANDTDFEGYTFVPGSNSPIPNVDYYQAVTAGYIETMGITVRKGRAFNAGDAGGAPVAIVNEALAKRFYPDQDPLGRRIRPSGGPNAPWYTIVGIVNDVKQGGLDVPAGTELYLDYEQLPRISGSAPSSMNVVLHSARPLAGIAPAIRALVKTMDPTLPIVQMRTMDDVVGASVTRQRFLSVLLGIFAAVALLLAGIGTYGILSYSVTERHREIGIRMALGASVTQVIGLVLGQGLMIAAFGIAAGIGGAMVLSRLVVSLLYGVSPSDPGVYASVALAISVVAVIACLVPARRATRVDPLDAMRTS